MTRQLINLSDLLFQLAGMCGAVAAVLSLSAQLQGRDEPFSVYTLAKLAAALAAVALITGVAATELYRRSRAAPLLN